MSKDIHGEWTIDAAELFRVYQPVPTVHSNGDVQLVANDALVHPPSTPSVETLQVTVAQLEMRLQEMVEARDQLVAAKDDTIADLRSRLDASNAQVNQLSAVIVGLQPQKAKSNWWQRLLGG